MKLIKVEINKYKSFTKPQSISINPEITVLVGKNESGKTAFLEAVAKTNYFEADNGFKFNDTNDYPRSTFSQYRKTGNTDKVITCTYELDDSELKKIADKVGKDVYLDKSLSITTNFDNGISWNHGKANFDKFIKHHSGNFGISKELLKEIVESGNIDSALEICNQYSGEENLSSVKELLQQIIKGSFSGWNDKLAGYISMSIIKPLLPKFWYFDEYYELPGTIDIKDLQNGKLLDDHSKTARALFDLAGIDISTVGESSNFEEYKAQLESTSNEITDRIFEYWKTNQDLDIQFDIQKERVTTKQNDPFEQVTLHVRIHNKKHRLTLPLSNRSKGFNWFFSFIVWFSKIQGDGNKNYILLLDEPGLNLHASAQADLLRFIDDLSKDYQIIYTTHSPFMIESNHLERVRTVYDGTEGSVISEAIQEKDSNTLFPLQAALGYDIAQNLFITQYNLLIEGVSDLIYLSTMSNVLEGAGRTGLDSKITLVPVGGLDKVAMFISLLRGSKLDIACLLDSFSLPQQQRDKLKNLIMEKITKEKNIRFFDEFSGNGGNYADIEDVFEKEDYIKLFNAAFNKQYRKLKTTDVSDPNKPIIQQINIALGIDRFNHYRPANHLASLGVDASYFKTETLDRFEKLFSAINKLF